jgi:hypothetical protein
MTPSIIKVEITTPIVFSSTATSAGTAEFTIEFSKYLECDIGHFAIWKVTNTGEVPFESANYWMEDLGPEITMGSSSSNSPFKMQPPLCAISFPGSSLDPSGTKLIYLSMVNVEEIRAESSHNIQISILLCTADNQEGECIYQISKATVP